MKDKVEKYKHLVEILEKSKKIKSLNEGSHVESEALAHSILDIIESSSLISNELFPKLMSQDISEEEIEDILQDISDEFRHILYHINDPKYFKHLSDSIG